MTQVLKVVAAVVTQHGATLYTQDGQARNITPAEHNCEELVAKIIAGSPSATHPVMVDLETNSVFWEVEKFTNGLLRFFTISKERVKDLLGIRSERGNVNPHGMVDSAPEDVDATQPGTEPVTPEIVTALEAAHEEAVGQGTDTTTVVAVVGDTPIVGAEALKGHAKAAVAQSNVAGFQRFMERLATVAKERKHTAQELIAFMEKNDLPIANDGTIIGFKSLTQTQEPGVYVDNYTHTWKQMIGTLVEMGVEMVDDNRRVLCSNGFHIARRAYLRSYGNSGTNSIFLVKIAPEMVISVPLGEQDKMRVAAYHIIAELTDQEKSRLSNGQSITQDNDFASGLLARVIQGHHVAVLHRTFRLKGKNTITQLEPMPDVTPAPVQEEAPPLQSAQTVDQYVEGPGQPLDVKAINAQVDAKQEAKRQRDRDRRAKLKEAKTAAAPKTIDTSKKQVVEVTTTTPTTSGVAKRSKVSLKAPPEVKRIQKETGIISAADVKANTPKAATISAQKEKAIKLFKAGKSRTEIRQRLNLSESTLRGWLKNL